MGAVRKALVGEEPEIAARALTKELREIITCYPDSDLNPSWIAGSLRKGEQLPVITEPIGLSIEVRTPITRMKNIEIDCQILFHIPVGYPIVPPVEQGEGDIVVNMTGSISKSSMRDIGRDIHIKVMKIYEASGDSLPSYLLNIIKWITSTCMTESVASKCIPRTLSSPQFIRKFIRFHHIESRIKGSFGLLWAADHSVTGFIARGQPALVMVEGSSDDVDVWTEKFTNVLHWGPIPAQVLLSHSCEGSGSLKKFKYLTDLYPSCVTVNGAFNGRDSVNFNKLQKLLPLEIAEQLSIIMPALVHDGGHVDAEQVELSIKQVLEIPPPKDTQTADKKKKKKKSRLQ